MNFKSKKDGSHYPVNTNSAASAQTFAAVAAQDRHRHRTLTRQQRQQMATLENPLLYSNFVKKLEKLNPGFDVQLIDKHLEPEEALLELKRKHPDIDIGLKHEEDHGAEFRQFLDDFGISNEKVQNLIAQDPNPLSEEELAHLSYVLNNRPAKAIETDNSIKAPLTRDVRAWMAKPNRLDIKGLDD